MKKSKEDEKTSEELNSAHRRLQAKCQLIQTSYLKRIKLLLFLPYNKHGGCNLQVAGCNNNDNNNNKNNNNNNNNNNNC